MAIFAARFLLVQVLGFKSTRTEVSSTGEVLVRVGEPALALRCWVSGAPGQAPRDLQAMAETLQAALKRRKLDKQWSEGDDDDPDPDDQIDPDDSATEEEDTSDKSEQEEKTYEPPERSSGPSYELVPLGEAAPKEPLKEPSSSLREDKILSPNPAAS